MSHRFDLCGDHLALDFANTLSDRDTPTPVERLVRYDDLVDFARQSGVLNARRAAAARAAGRRDPAAAARALAEAVALREALYALFAAVAQGQPPPADALSVLNEQLCRLRVGDDLELSWRDDGAPGDFLGAVVRAAVELATSPGQRERVRLCEAPDCQWLFYDGSKNRSRRWCDMRQCGNRMKARRHYARARAP